MAKTDDFDVQFWLAEQGFESVASAFTEHQVDDRIKLYGLNEGDLSEMGVPIGMRAAILRKIGKKRRRGGGGSWTPLFFLVGCGVGAMGFVLPAAAAGIGMGALICLTALK